MLFKKFHLILAIFVMALALLVVTNVYANDNDGQKGSGVVLATTGSGFANTAVTTDGITGIMKKYFNEDLRWHEKDPLLFTSLGKPNYGGTYTPYFDKSLLTKNTGTDLVPSAYAAIRGTPGITEDPYEAWQRKIDEREKRHDMYLGCLSEKFSTMIKAIQGNTSSVTAALTYKGTTALVTQRPVDPGYLLKLKEGLTTQDMTSDNIVAMQSTGRAEIPLFTELGLKGVRLSKDMQTAAAARTGLSLTNFDEDEMVGRISTLEKVSIV
ncbi:hypothetical protein HOG29_00065 [bacterium]|jgi:hypothetical protein|nr:hypothetical protein [bacterium]